MTGGGARVERSAFAAARDLTITVEAGDAPPMRPDEQRRWEALRGANPALFDGAIYSVTSLDSAAGVMRCRRGRYREIVLRRPGDDVRLLSVTGLLVHEGSRVLLGQRGAKLRSYPGMWEIGPAGGVEPAEGEGQVSIERIRAALAAEIVEEIGVAIDTGGAQCVGVCSDDAARSLDIVLRIDLEGTAPAPRHGDGWEYEDAAWVAIGDLPRFTAQRATIAPSRAIMQALGWI
ncbi:MAG: NUDIX hydrolase [Phycisphaerales bacterium JB039]